MVALHYLPISHSTMQLSHNAIACLVASAESGSKQYSSKFQPVLKVVRKTPILTYGKYPTYRFIVADGSGDEMPMKMESADPKLNTRFYGRDGHCRKLKSPGRFCLLKFHTRMDKFYKHEKERPMIIVEKLALRVPKPKSAQKKSPPKPKKISVAEYMENCKCGICTPCECSDVPDSDSDPYLDESEDDRNESSSADSDSESVPGRRHALNSDPEDPDVPGMRLALNSDPEESDESGLESVPGRRHALNSDPEDPDE